MKQFIKTILFLVILNLTACVSKETDSPGKSATLDQWNKGEPKTAIIEFVAAVPKTSSRGGASCAMSSACGSELHIFFCYGSKTARQAFTLAPYHAAIVDDLRKKEYNKQLLAHLYINKLHCS